MENIYKNLDRESYSAMRLPENAKDDFTKLKEEKAELRRKLDQAESELKASKEIAQRQ